MERLFYIAESYYYNICYGNYSYEIKAMVKFIFGLAFDIYIP